MRREKGCTTIKEKRVQAKEDRYKKRANGEGAKHVMLKINRSKRMSNIFPVIKGSSLLIQLTLLTFCPSLTLSGSLEVDTPVWTK